MPPLKPSKHNRKPPAGPARHSSQPEADPVFATLDQRPLTQGRLAFEALHRFIVEEIRPKPVQKLPPYIVLRSNLDVFLESSHEYDGRDPSLAVEPPPAAKTV